MFVISDLEHNKVIASRGYYPGYGYVVEQEISTVFKGIATFDDLQDAFNNRMSLGCINKEGYLLKVIKDFCFLRLY